MSVSIVSTLPQPTQAPPADATAAGSDLGVTGLDFANILLSQQLINLNPSDYRTEPSTTEDVDSNSPTPDAATADASSILATLGLVPMTEPVRTADAGKTANAEDLVSGTTVEGQPSAALATKFVSGQALKPEADPNASTLPEPSLATAGAEEKSAKFAVPAAAMPQKPLETEVSLAAEPLAKTISTVASSVTTSTAHHEALPSVQTHIRDQSWSSEFTQKIVWLANTDKQTAQLTLNPPQMGPIDISISVEKGNANASFVSANAEVRDAIETALPKLREMFASAGIELGQTNVSSESFRQQSENSTGMRNGSRARGDNDILAADSVGSLAAQAFQGRVTNGMVDIFA